LPKWVADEIERHDLIVVCDILSKSFVIEISKIVRESKTQGLIWAVTAGLYGFVLDDFGPGFKVFDKDGEQPFPYNIENISSSDPGVVRVIKEKQHNLQTGDFVCIHDVEGMIEVNGNEPRPIKVISPYEFSIEDTTSFTPYQKSGLVQLAKVPFRLSFPKLEDQLYMPQTDQPRHLMA
jgi:ubiquitin-activating enzyme E1